MDALNRVHKLASDQYPHDYLDTGLGAAGLFLHKCPANAGYQQTPVNSVSFAGIGVDGIHFGTISANGTLAPSAPVVVTIPMALDQSNFIVGESIYDFLCLGCERGFHAIANLDINQPGSLETYASHNEADDFDERIPEILALMRRELCLEPWSDVQSRFRELQDLYIPALIFGQD